MRRSNQGVRTSSKLGLWMILWLALSGAVQLCLPPVEAAGPFHSEERLLSVVEDTVPSPTPTRAEEIIFPYGLQIREYGSLLVQPPTRYDLSSEAERFSILPFESALAGLGNVWNRSGLFYNLFQETDYLPGLFLYGHVNMTGEESGRGIDTQLKLMASKSLGGGSGSLRRVHMNLSWKYNGDPRDNERDSSYVAIVGYDHSISPDLLIVLDFVREREFVDFRNLNILQMGLRYNLTPLTVLSLGAGSSLDFDTPALRAVFGFQQSF